jgi:hypothetical protein
MGGITSMGRHIKKPYGLLESMTNTLLFFYTLIIVFIIIIACQFAQEKKEECEKTYNGFATEGELNAMRYLHKYHGTMWSENGTFERDGHTCQLWDPRVRTDM